MADYVLKNWVVRSITDDYKAPEQCGRQLKGEVEGHPRHKNGAVVSTSPIVMAIGRRVITKNSTYVLEGPPHPSYLEWMIAHGYEYDPEQPIKIKAK